MEKVNSKTPSRTWFLVFQHPLEHGFSGSYDDVLVSIRDVWMTKYPQGCCCLRYCIKYYDDGHQDEHVHAVLENKNSVRYSTIQSLFPHSSIFPTAGNKSQVEDYINKRGKYAEVNEKVLASLDVGDIHGALLSQQGKRNDILFCNELINQGMTPRQITTEYPMLITKDSYIKKLFYQKRYNETPRTTDIDVYWHIGPSGSGKSYSTICGLSDKYGDENVYVCTDYINPFDLYNGEPIVIFEEFRGSFKYSDLLTYTDIYKIQLHARYNNVCKLWREVHFTSIETPEQCYAKMVSESERGADTIDQLKRRIKYYIYHAKFDNCYPSITIPAGYWRGVDFGIDCLRAYNGLLPVRYKLPDLLPVLNYNAEIDTKKATPEAVEKMKNNNSFADLANEDNLTKMRKNTFKELSDGEDLPF